MSVSLFLMLLTMFSAITGICTEGVKNLLNDRKIEFSSNALAFIIACIVGIGGTAIYYILCNIPFAVNNVVCMILMGIASAMGAMVGYDKVVQAIKQFGAMQE